MSCRSRSQIFRKRRQPNSQVQNGTSHQQTASVAPFLLKGATSLKQINGTKIKDIRPILISNLSYLCCQDIQLGHPKNRVDVFWAQSTLDARQCDATRKRKRNLPSSMGVSTLHLEAISKDLRQNLRARVQCRLGLDQSSPRSGHWAFPASATEDSLTLHDPGMTLVPEDVVSEIVHEVLVCEVQHVVVVLHRQVSHQEITANLQPELRLKQGSGCLCNLTRTRGLVLR